MNKEKDKIILNIGERMEPLGDLFGIFFEDINHAADGGLYGEMVHNRSFEFSPVDNEEYHSLYAWEAVEDNDCHCDLKVKTDTPLSEVNPHYIKMTVTGAGAGIINQGYNSGFYIQKGESYHFTCYARNNEIDKKVLRISLEGEEGCYGFTSVEVEEGPWAKYEGIICVSKTDTSARLKITLEMKGSIELDFVSLFPEKTFGQRRNGMRKDLADLLADMKPKFMRFPGGCLIHSGSLNPEARDSVYRWKKSIGAIEDRPARKNIWGYNQTLGLGFYECFLFCEDIKAKPLPVLPAGYNPHKQEMVPMDELQPWIEDALDLIEFANGDENTKWGSIRAAMGHPAPFGLEYLGIGNEEVGEGFFERYEYFHKAIREKYPDIKIICTSGPNAAGSEFERGWSCGKRLGSDYIDEHYYQTPEWFLANYHRYDTYETKGPKVFLGEYGTWGKSWYHALVEAAYMIGLERNADKVGLACYAPLLANEDYVNWDTNLIWFNNHKVCPTPNYYVQKLFMNHQGTRKLRVSDVPIKEEKREIEPLSGNICFKGYQSICSYKDIRIQNDLTGEIHFIDHLEADTSNKAMVSAVSHWTDYTISTKAEVIEGEKGFEINFAWKDTSNYRKWTIGGWQNYDLFLSHIIDGRSSDLTQALFTVEPHRVYDLKLQVKDRYIRTWIDGEESLATEDKEVVIEPLYYTASEDETDGAIIIKVANLQEEAVNVQINLRDWQLKRVNGKIFTMDYDREATNTFSQLDKVIPVESEFSCDEEELNYQFPSMSLTIMRLYNRQGHG